MKYERELCLRYGLALAFGIFNQAFYFVMAPLTLYASYFLLNLFYPAELDGIRIITEKGVFVFIEACVATLAYLLLALLILSTKDLGAKKSLAMFLHGGAIIFVVNLFRIELLIYAFLEKKNFDFIHMIFWEFISTLLVFFTWLYLISRYKVKTMPVVSDMKYLWGRIKR